jgi:hypothetical protein
MTLALADDRQVGTKGSPEVAITAPADAAMDHVENTWTLDGTVSDDVDPAPALLTWWSSNIDGKLSIEAVP